MVKPHISSPRTDWISWLGSAPLELLAEDEDAGLRPRWLIKLMEVNNEASPFEDQATGWLSPEEGRRFIEATFGDALSAPPFDWGDPNAPGALSRFIFEGLAAHRVERDGTGFVLSVDGLSTAETRPGFAPYGGVARMDEGGQVECIEYQGRTYHPEDPEWAHVRFVFRSTAFATVTLEDHLIRSHYAVSNGFALACHRHLEPHHPLRRFLKPFMFRTGAINHGALQSLLPEGAIIHRAGALTLTALRNAIHRARGRCTIRPFDEDLQARTLHPRQLSEPARERYYWGLDGIEYWNRLRAFVADAFDASPVLRGALQGEVRPQTKRFWEELVALGILEDTPLDGPNLERALAALVFEVTAFHAHVGRVAPYVRDCRFVASRVWKGAVTADRQNTLQQCAVATFTGLPVPTIDEDWSHLAPDPRSKEAVDRFRRSLTEWQEELDGRNARRAQPFLSFSPRLMPCSVSR